MTHLELKRLLTKINFHLGFRILSQRRKPEGDANKKIDELRNKATEFGIAKLYYIIRNSSAGEILNLFVNEIII